jgi:hypothetical protein
MTMITVIQLCFANSEKKQASQTLNSFLDLRNEPNVYWYIAETEEMTVSLSHEHRGYLWLDWEQALETITHEETRTVVRQAQMFHRLNSRQ